MNKTIAICSLIAVAVVLSVCVITEPMWLSDSNGFLREFMNNEILAILGVILAITLASAAQLHLEFNKIEERLKSKFLEKSRAGVRGAAYALIGAFLSAALLVVLKPIVDVSERSQAVVNALGLLILFFNVIILIEITQAAFSIPAHIDDTET